MFATALPSMGETDHPQQLQKCNAENEGLVKEIWKAPLWAQPLIL